MKTAFAFSLLALTTPGAATAADSAVPVQAKFVDETDPVASEVYKLGDYAITRLAMTLVSEVTVAINKNGAEKAVDVCHLKALPLTKDGITGLPRITEIKRTSLKLRNPANAPDAAEQLALNRVQQGIEAGVLPKVLVQEITTAPGKREWRVYRPVAVAPQCVTCHGSRDSFSPELRARLAERYPKDEAIGYTAGQWRGLIRVTVSDAPPAAPGKKS